MINYLRRLLLEISIPITKAISLVQSPNTITTSEQLLDIKSKISNGDIVLCIKYYELSNSLMPSKWKHCGVYFDGWVYESTTKGVRKVLLEEFFFKKDCIGLVSTRVLHGPSELKRGLDFLVKNLREPYDFGFTFKGSSSWYCSKYVYQFLLACNPGLATQLSFIKVLGEITIKPEDFWFADKVFLKVASYNTKGDLCV